MVHGHQYLRWYALKLYPGESRILVAVVWIGFRHSRHLHSRREHLLRGHRHRPDMEVHRNEYLGAFLYTVRLSASAAERFQLFSCTSVWTIFDGAVKRNDCFCACWMRRMTN